MGEQLYGDRLLQGAVCDVHQLSTLVGELLGWRQLLSTRQFLSYGIEVWWGMSSGITLCISRGGISGMESQRQQPVFSRCPQKMARERRKRIFSAVVMDGILRRVYQHHARQRGTAHDDRKTTQSWSSWCQELIVTADQLEWPRCGGKEVGP